MLFAAPRDRSKATKHFRLHPCGVNPKPGPLGWDSFLKFFRESFDHNLGGPIRTAEIIAVDNQVEFIRRCVLFPVCFLEEIALFFIRLIKKFSGDSPGIIYDIRYALDPEIPGADAPYGQHPIARKNQMGSPADKNRRLDFRQGKDGAEQFASIIA